MGTWEHGGEGGKMKIGGQGRGAGKLAKLANYGVMEKWDFREMEKDGEYWGGGGHMGKKFGRDAAIKKTTMGWSCYGSRLGGCFVLVFCSRLGSALLCSAYPQRANI